MVSKVEPDFWEKITRVFYFSSSAPIYWHIRIKSDKILRIVEILRLGITEQAIAQTEKHVVATTDVDDQDSIAVFTRGVNKRLYREQPLLQRYLRNADGYFNISSPLAFGYAAALTYDMIPQKAREQVLTNDNIEIMHTSLFEHRENADEPNSPLDTTWFTDKLENDSPDYIGWLGEMLTDFDDQETKKDFALGSIIVAMAFYLRADAEILKQT